MRLRVDLELLGEVSWTSCLKKGEFLGGPSEWGNSRYQAFKHCPFYYWWTYVKRMTPVTYDQNLELGGLFHEVLARYFQAWLDHTEPDGSLKAPRATVDDACLAAGNDLLSRAERVVPGLAGTARRLWRAFLSLYGPKTAVDFRPSLMGVETVLEVKQPFPYSARLDLWLWDEELNGPKITEIKTAASRTTQLVESYRMDSQFLGHKWLWEQTMKRRYGDLARYDVLLVTKAADLYIGLESVNFKPEVVKDWEQEMRWTYAQLVQCEMSGHWPKRRTWRCRRGNHPCALYDYCSAGDDSAWRKKRKGE